jgi:hypothetical protein
MNDKRRTMHRPTVDSEANEERSKNLRVFKDVAALNTGRNSIGIDIDPEYCRMALRRLDSESGPLFSRSAIEYRAATDLLAPAAVPAVADRPRRMPAGRRVSQRSLTGS